MLLIFISLILGILLFRNAILISIVLFLFLGVIFWRFGKKKGVKCTAASFLGFLLFISIFSYESSLSSVKSYYFIEKSSNNYYIITNYVSKFYVYEKNNQVEVGDLVYIEGKTEEIETISLESSFDFKEYLVNNGVYKRVNVAVFKKIINYPYRRKIQIQSFKNGFSEDSFNLVSNMIFGVSNDSEITNFMKSNNLIYLLGQSGVFVICFLRLIEFIFSYKLDNKKSYIVTSVIGFLFMITSIYSVTYIRTFLIYLLHGHSSNFGNKKKYADIISFVSCVFLLINPFFAFQLSIILPLILSLFFQYIQKINNDKSKIIVLFKRFVLSFIFMFPLQLMMANQINILGFFIQLLLIPVFQVIYITAKISILGYSNFILDWMSFAVKKSFNFIDFFSIKIYAPAFRYEFLVIYYFLICVFLLIIEKRCRKLSISFTVIFIISITIYLLPVYNLNIRSVSFINVGQGDSTLINDKGVYTLIDTGGSLFNDIALNSLIPFFKKQRIYSIDNIIITHDDFDHNGALNSLITNFKVKKVIKSKDSFPLKLNTSLLMNLNTNDTGDDNEKSLVLYLELSNKKFLFMGDAPVSVEKEIIKNNNLKCDILKIGHHGSDTSTCEEFIKAVSPKEAVVSVGKNAYGHPNLKVLNLLNKYGVIIKRTDKVGSVIYTY